MKGPILLILHAALLCTGVLGLQMELEIHEESTKATRHPVVGAPYNNLTIAEETRNNVTDKFVYMRWGSNKAQFKIKISTSDSYCWIASTDCSDTTFGCSNGRFDYSSSNTYVSTITVASIPYFINTTNSGTLLGGYATDSVCLNTSISGCATNFRFVSLLGAANMPDVAFDGLCGIRPY